jgi:CubicO group peptidase (beta-lactamase class C family)
LKNYFLIGLSVLLFSCHSSKDPDKLNNDPATIAAAMQPTLNPEEQLHYSTLASRYFDSILRRNHFNGAILVAKNGVVVYEKYVGYKNIRTKDTLTPNTSLQIASTSKTLTSAAVLQLIQQGKLDLNAPVAQFFPGFPYPDITVKMLLTHRSGLPEYLYFFEKNGWDRNTYATNDDVINALIKWQPGRAFRANTRFDYCNTNFALLASIVEKVSGIPFPQYMKQNIFEPLNMDNSYVFTINDTARSAQSYDWNGTQWAMDFSDGVYGDKNVYSTPQDLLKWDQALYSDQVISQQLLDSAFTPYSNEKPSLHNYGLGWRLLVYPQGKKVVYHNGRWHGFNSAFARLTDEKVTIIMLVNKFNKSVYTVARKMYNTFGDYEANHIGEVE